MSPDGESAASDENQWHAATYIGRRRSGPGLVLVHPRGGPADVPASLPSGIVLDGETPEQGALRLVREQTGLDVAITERLVDSSKKGPRTASQL